MEAKTFADGGVLCRVRLVANLRKSDCQIRNRQSQKLHRWISPCLGNDGDLGATCRDGW